MARVPRTAFAISLLAVLVSTFAPLGAQTTNATLVGTVTDEQGAVVPGAKVTAKSNATGNERTVVSDASGDYRP